MAAGRHSNDHKEIAPRDISTIFIQCSKEGSIDDLLGLLNDYFGDIFYSGALDLACQNINDPVQRRELLKKAIHTCPASYIPHNNSTLTIKSLLHLVTEYNEIALAIDLITQKKHAIDITFESNDDNQTPLLLAINLDNKVMVQLLLMQKANIEFVSQLGLSPLQAAIYRYRKHGDMSVIKLLLNHFSTANLKTGYFFNTLAMCSYPLSVRRDATTGLMYDILPVWKECLTNINDVDVLLASDELGVSPIQYIMFYRHKDLLLLIIQKLKTLNFFSEKVQPLVLSEHEKNFSLNMLMLCEIERLPSLLIGLVKPSLSGEPKIRQEVMNHLLGSISKILPLKKFISNELHERLIAIFEFYQAIFKLIDSKNDNLDDLLQYTPTVLPTFILNIDDLSSFEKNIVAYLKDVLLRLRSQMELHITAFLQSFIAKRIVPKKVQRLIDHLKETFYNMTSMIAIQGVDDDWSKNLAINQPLAKPIKQPANVECNDPSPIRTACMEQDIEKIIYLLEEKKIVPEFDILIVCIDFNLNASVKALLDYSFRYHLKALFENIMSPYAIAVRAKNETALNMLIKLGEIAYPHLLRRLSIELKYLVHRIVMKQDGLMGENEKLNFYYRSQQTLKVNDSRQSRKDVVVDYFIYFFEQIADDADVQAIVGFLHSDKAIVSYLLGNINELTWLSLARSISTKKVDINRIWLAMVELMSIESVTSPSQLVLTHPSLAHIAVYFKSKMLINALNTRGCRLDLSFLPLGATPLHVAAGAEEYLEILRHLLYLGVDIDSVDAKGRTALYFAMMKKNIPAATELIDKGAAIDKTGENSISPLKLALHLYMSRESVELTRFIIQKMQPKYLCQAEHRISSNEASLFFYALSGGLQAQDLIDCGFLPPRIKSFYHAEFIDYTTSLIHAVNDFPVGMKQFSQGVLNYVSTLVAYASVNKISNPLIEDIEKLPLLLLAGEKIDINWDSLEYMQKEYCLSILWLFSILIENATYTLNKISLAIRSSILPMAKQKQLILSLLNNINQIDIFSLNVHLNHMSTWYGVMEKAKFVLGDHLDQITEKEKQDKILCELLDDEKKPKIAPKKNKKKKVKSIASTSIPPAILQPVEPSEHFILLNGAHIANIEPILQLVEGIIGSQPFLIGGAVLSLLAPELMKTNDFDLVFSGLDEDGGIAHELRDKKFHLPPPHPDQRLTLYQYRNEDRSVLVDLIRVNGNDPDWVPVDAKKRDFSVCTIYAQLFKQSDGRYKMVMQDPTGRGLSDFKKRILYMEDPLRRFNEDPVRLLRAIKYMAKGFEPDATLLAAIQDWQPRGDLMSPYVVDHLWSVLKQTVDLSKPTLNEQDQLFFFYLKDLGLAEKLFGIKIEGEVAEVELKAALVRRSKMRKLSEYVDYTPSLFRQKGVLPSVYSLDYVLGSSKPRN